MSSSIYFPQVTTLPSQNTQNESSAKKSVKKAPGEFDRMMDQVLEKHSLEELNQIRKPIKFSAHATQRLEQRGILMDQNLSNKLDNAVKQAEAKGIEDTLVLMDEAAFIVSVPNRTVVTAMDRENMNGNVFTNIDGAIIV